MPKESPKVKKEYQLQSQEQKLTGKRLSYCEYTGEKKHKFT